MFSFLSDNKVKKDHGQHSDIGSQQVTRELQFIKNK